MPLPIIPFTLALLAFVLCPGFVTAKQLVVGPTGIYRSIDMVPWRTLAPGDVVLLQDDVAQTRATVISARGLSDNPIRITAAMGAQPILRASVVFENSQHVILERISVNNAQDAGIIIRGNSEAITVRNTVLHNNGLGLWIGDGAKGSHRIIDNEMSNNRTHGIGVFKVANEPGRETILAGNRVFKNGHHGFEITGSRFVIEDNIVYENGQTQFGISGIHLYAGGFLNAPRIAGMGTHNIIRYNIVSRNLDHRAQDGNGIQADTWCDDNEIYYNVVFENDGAGIVVYDGARNHVFNNTLFANARDPGRTHRFRGEIVVASDETSTIRNTLNNVVRNNILTANSVNSAAIAIDAFSAATTEFSNNLLFNMKSGPLYSWGERMGRDIAQWNQLSRAKPSDVAADPLFENPGDPSNGLRLRPQSPAIQLGGDVQLTRDIQGSPIPPGSRPSSGAYQFVP